MWTENSTCQTEGSVASNITHSSESYRADVTYYICGPILTVFIIIGVLGNSACLCVFLQRRPSNTRRTARLIQPIYVYLLTLASWDLILLWASFLLYNLPEISEGRSLTHPLHLFSLPYVYYATNTAHSCSNWVVVALGVERYFALCYPFKHRLLDGRRRAIYVSCSISLAAVLYSLPRLFETHVCMNEEQSAVEFNRFLQNVFYKMVYKVTGGMLMYSVGPFLCLLFVSVRVSAAVRQQRLFQAEKTRRAGRSPPTVGSPLSHKRMRLTKSDPTDCSYSINVMLIIVIIKLLFVHSLPTALDITEATMGDQAFGNNKLVNFLVDASILLVVINSSCNFFVYYACSRQFRQELCGLWPTLMGYSRVEKVRILRQKDSANSIKRDCASIASDNSAVTDLYSKLSTVRYVFGSLPNKGNSPNYV